MKTATLISLSHYQTDPRQALDSASLEAASHNRFPIVANHVQRWDRFGLMTGAAGALLLGGFVFWSMSQHRAAPQTAPAPLPIFSPPAPLAVPAVKPSAPQIAMPPAEDAARHLNAPALILDSANVVIPTAAAAATAGPAGGAKPSPAQPLSPDEAFADRIANMGADRASAVPMSDPGHTVAQGALISAVLETAINSDLPGYARAVVSQDVRSFDGSQILIPRASHLIGQYKSGVAEGQRRAYILWSRLVRPDGVSIALASPTTDFSGKTGIAGEVDTHFFARFGSAILLSVVDLFSAIGNAAVVVSGGTSAASVAAQRDAQIPPTITVPQGTPIRIFTARDLDFSTIPAEVAQK